MFVDRNHAMVKIFFGFCLSLMVFLAVAGGVLNYSEVPYMDMWDGTLNFFVRLNRGDYWAWWDQHNEHRIVLSRIVFWMDYHFFGGVNLFSELFNYVLFSLVIIQFYAFYKDMRLSDKLGDRGGFVFLVVVFSWLILWTQSDNFTVGFQSQFILAQLLPLSSFYFLAKSVGKSSRSYYVGALLFSMLAVGSMANGILAFPLLFLLSMFFELKLFNKVQILIASLVFPAIYLFGYHSPVGHGNLIDSLMQTPGLFLSYVMVYFGGPFYYLVGKGIFGHWFAFCMGGFFLVVYFYFLIKLWVFRKYSNFDLAIVAFLTYIVFSAFVTAGGRVIFGLDQALSTRYTTPVLMAWVGLLFVCLSRFEVQKFFSESCGLVLGMLIMLMMVGVQFKALKYSSFIYQQPALAISMNVNDRDLIKVIYPDSDRALHLAALARHDQVSIFSRPPYSEESNRVGVYFSMNGIRQECHGSVDHLYNISSQPDFIKVDGWILGDSSAKSIGRVIFVNDANQVAGYAVVGYKRPDVVSKYGSVSNNSGFGGYIKKSLITSKMFAIPEDLSCVLKL